MRIEEVFFDKARQIAFRMEQWHTIGWMLSAENLQYVKSYFPFNASMVSMVSNYSRGKHSIEAYEAIQKSLEDCQLMYRDWDKLDDDIIMTRYTYQGKIIVRLQIKDIDIYMWPI